MKKYFSILGLVLMAMCSSVVLTSCGDDDDEVVENKNNTIVGSWFIEEDGDNVRDVLTFYADGTYVLSWQDVKKDSSKKYYDENLTEYQSKGFYTAANGILNMKQTHERDCMGRVDGKEKGVVDWVERPAEWTHSYEIIDGNTLNIYSAYEDDEDEDEIVTYTRVK